jgi:hypothetical protein
VEAVSTPTENNFLNGYLTKITILIAICPCNLASFYGHPFLAYSLRCFLGETTRKCPWLPAIAITSEKWDFGRFFGSWRGSRFAAEHVYGFFSKTFSGKYFFSTRNVFGKYFFAFENFPENVLTLEKKIFPDFFAMNFFMTAICYIQKEPDS